MKKFFVLLSILFIGKIIHGQCGIACPANIITTATAGQCGAVVTFSTPTAPASCPVVTAKQSFAFTGSIVNWTVPTGISQITILAKGAQGGDNKALDGAGGKGAIMKGTFTVLPGQVLNIIVGERGHDNNEYGNEWNSAGGGGGGSFVWISGSNNPLIVAGGGGGSCLQNNGSPHYFGKDASISTNGTGSRSHDLYNDAPGGINGSKAPGVCGGKGWIDVLTDPNGVVTTQLAYGANGGFGGGGASGHYDPYSCNYLHVAGGGGGYSGGGGGGKCYYHGGGGGGSFNSGTNQENSVGNIGNGSIEISWGTEPTVTQTEGLVSGSIFPVGITTNTFKLDDGNGNISTCSFTVTVKDEEKPSIALPANQTVNTEPNGCEATVDAGTATAMDNCTGEIIVSSVRSDGLPLGDPFPVGSTIITWTAKDAAGNVATGEQTITIKRKLELTAPTNITVKNDLGTCAAKVYYTAPTIESCVAERGSGIFNYTGGVQTFTVPEGVTSIKLKTWGAQGGKSVVCGGTYDDDGGLGGYAEGNINVTPGQTLFIYVGGQPNYFANSGSNETFEGGFNGGGTGGYYGAGGGGATDVRIGGNNLINRVLVAGGGGGGNTGCPNHGTGGAGGGLTGQKGTALSGWLPEATGGTQTAGGTAGYAGLPGSLGKGGDAGNYYGSPYHYAGGGGGYYGGGSAFASGGGGGSSYIGGVVNGTTTLGVNTGHGKIEILWESAAQLAVTQTAGLPSGATFPVGTTTNTFEVTDEEGNVSTCSFTVTVEDKEAPIPNIEVLPDVTSECSVTVTAPTATDNCQGSITGTTTDPTTYPTQGTYTITWTYDDGNGNSTTQKQKVVVDDITPPTFTQPASQNVSLDENCSFQVPNLIGELSGTDNCGMVTFTQSPAVGAWISSAHNSTHSVIITAHDGYGNTTQCVVVLTAKDETDPTIVAPKPRTILLGANCTYVVPNLLEGVTGLDNCGIVSFTQMPLAGTVLTGAHSGSSTVYVTAHDGNGNSSSAGVVLTLQDATDPVLTVPMNVTINCHDSKLPFTTGTATATDNCDGRPDVTYSDISTQTASGIGQFNYSITRTWKAEDATGNTVTANQVITVNDVTAPVTVCKNHEVHLDLNGRATITASAVDGGTTDNCDNNVQLSLNQNTFTAAGTYMVTLTATDISGNTSSCTATVMVKRRPTIITYTGDGSEQYSDQQVLTALLKDQLTGSLLSSKSVGFTLGVHAAEGTTNTSGIATANLVLTQDPAPAYNVVSSFAGDAIFEPSSDTDPFDITREDARAFYTGATFTSTSGSTSGKATVTMSATVKDITSVLDDVAYDGYQGDITKASLTFINRDNNTEIATVPIGLVNGGDAKVGTATYNWNVDIGSSDSKQFTVGMRINNYYTYDVSEENTVVTVSKPLNDFITGGGFLILKSSAGEKKGDAGTKNNFGFNVKYNKRGTNLQGNINTIVRRREADGILHVYQIKGNAMSSLSVDASKTASHPYPTAVFNGKASIQDITDPYNPVSVDGNATLQVELTDAGEPGSSDKIAVTVWNKSGGLWFASNWDGTRTVEQLLAGGNLKVSGGSFSISSSNINTKLPVRVSQEELRDDGKLAVKVLSNPATHYFTLVTSSSNNLALQIRMVDAAGKLIEFKGSVAPNGSIAVGHNWRPGLYYAEVVQGEQRVVVKLLKGSE